MNVSQEVMNVGERINRIQQAFEKRELQTHALVSRFQIRDEWDQVSGAQSLSAWGDALQRSGGGWGSEMQR